MIGSLLGAAAALLLAAQPAPGARVEDLAWMSGRWLTGENGRWTEEIWSGPRGGTLMGFSWSGEGRTIREYEYIYASRPGRMTRSSISPSPMAERASASTSSGRRE